MKNILYILLLLTVQSNAQLAFPTPSSIDAPLQINNSTTPVTGLYSVAMARWTGDFEFFQDQYFRLDFAGDQLRIVAIGGSKNIGINGFNIAETASGLPVTENATGLAKSGFATVDDGTFTLVSDTRIRTHIDMQTFWR